ncbi:uncharacterized protein LOC110414836 [Herrania umbratica]|uniref:Uncharacterized protein LOC110414836 n=1 Tax=Herrania umbratica TaxID=108875 RepID=A0A6J1A5D5_9ROSI|nr:uncharacterized protein LOC110414836 [Herrania umbratica]
MFECGETRSQTSSQSQTAQNQTQVSLVKDPRSPNYLHHTDHLNLVIVNPKFNTNNYVTCSRSFLLALSIRNKVGFINRTIIKLAITYPLFLLWTRYNNLIVAWQLDSMSPPIASTVFYMDFVSNIWNTLKQNYAQPNDSRICNLQYTLGNVTKGTRSVDSYFVELKSIWEKMRNYRPLPHCECGKCNRSCFKRNIDKHQKDMVFRFLNGLNDPFVAIRSQIILMNPIPALDKVYSLVLRKKAQRNLMLQVLPTLESSAMLTATNGKKSIKKTSLVTIMGRKSI